jgi:hypothetical protein
MSKVAFVPADFVVPAELVCDEFRLTPLLPDHNDADYAAWTSSADHIHATPGFAEREWPVAMPKEQNLRDLEQHAADFGNRTGFTYTVVSPTDEVIGCVYIYPPEQSRADADVEVRSWVRGDHAALDAPLFRAVSAWLRSDWPFAAIDYAERP